MISCVNGNNPPSYCKAVVDIEFELGTDLATAKKAVDEMVKASSQKPYSLKTEDNNLNKDQDWDWDKDQFKKGSKERLYSTDADADEYEKLMLLNA